MEAGTEAANSAEIEGQKVKKQGTVSLRGQGDHLAFLFVCRFIENMLQVRCLTAQTGAVIDDLAVNFTSGKINKAQGSPSIRTKPRYLRPGPKRPCTERLFYIITYRVRAFSYSTRSG